MQVNNKFMEGIPNFQHCNVNSLRLEMATISTLCIAITTDPASTPLPFGLVGILECALDSISLWPYPRLWSENAIVEPSSWFRKLTVARIRVEEILQFASRTPHLCAKAAVIGIHSGKIS